MANIADIKKLALDVCHNTVEKYSLDEGNDRLLKAMIEINGGKNYLDARSMRDGASNGLFALIESTLDTRVIEGLQENDYFMGLVETRNLALGDQNLFNVEDGNLYAVAEIAPGTQGIRRQRIGEVKQVPVPTSYKGVKIYEELERVMAGRVDFAQMINDVTKSFQRKIVDDVYALWANASAEEFGEIYFPAAGSYNEATLLTLIEHVEAASGKTATLVGTKAALRNLQNSMQSIDAANAIYHDGYMGSFYGSPVISIPQRHKINSTEFVISDKIISVIASDDKPIKLVYEGNSLIIPGNPENKADLTQEYFAAQKYGTAIVVGSKNTGIGRYELT